MGEISEKEAEGQGRVFTIVKAFTGITRMVPLSYMNAIWLHYTIVCNCLHTHRDIRWIKTMQDAIL